MTPEQELVSVKEYLERRITDSEKNFETRIQALEKATTLAAMGMEKRLEGMNEFRASLKDQAATFATNTAVDMRLDTVKADVRIIQNWIAEQKGKASLTSVIIFGFIAVVSFILTVLKFFGL